MSKRNQKGRDINGVVLLDKASGGTSNHVLQQVKRLFGANKAGHTGSLDPIASGLLPICLGQATKVAQFLLDDDKRYFVRAKLGQISSTGDSEGKVVNFGSTQGIDESSISEMISYKNLEEALVNLDGPLAQQRAYELSRVSEGMQIIEFLLEFSFKYSKTSAFLIWSIYRMMLFFQPFYQLDDSRNRNKGGVGLGMTIALDIVLSHGGDVLLEDSKLGGLRVIISLPV